MLSKRFARPAVCLSLTLALVMVPVLSVSTTNALDAPQQKIFDRGIYYYDVASCGEDVPTATPGSITPSSIDGGALYVLGDSITVRTDDLLKSGFESKDFKPYINASESRSIKGKGTTSGFKTSGLEAAEDDKARIDNAKTVVIALGTNNPTPANFENDIKDLVTKIKSYDKDNSGLKIYWVNIFSKGGSNGYGKVDAEKINKSINKLASTEDFTVIDTTDKKIELDDSVHPKAPEGTKKFADTVVNGVAGAGGANPATPSVDNNCTCLADPDTQLSGSENAEKIWNYFIDKGLKPVQVAGMLGNIKVESNFNPRSLQPSTTGDFPVAGQGYGLVQWTDRHANLIRRSQEKKVKIYDLAFQIDHIWWELNGPEKAAFDDFKKQTTLEGSWKSFSHKYERPAAPDNPERGTAAQDALTKYGSNSGGGGNSTSGAVACTKNDGGGGSGEVTGEYSLPIPKKWYKSNPGYFTGPHHGDPNDPAVDIPVPRGTPVYSVTDGKITAAPNEGGYGQGVTIVAPNGVRYDYGHGYDGGTVSGAKNGDTVKAGQLIMHVNDTGSSRGDHLHLSILVGGKEVCPQKFLVSIAKGAPLDPKTLPSTGCTPV